MVIPAPSIKKIKYHPLKSGVHLQWELEVDAFSLPGKEDSGLSNDYHNSEGYPDPTAGEALSKIAANEKQSLRAFRPIVYICSPYSGDVEANVAAARRYSRFAVDKESSSALYQAYRNYSLDCNEYVRSTADFYFALEKAGFERLTLNRKRFFKGLKIHEDTGAEEDFLQ